MRRVYYSQRPAVQEAMRQMRATQDALGPEMMERIKTLVGPMEDQAPEPIYAAREPVDRKKNMLIVMKFLQIKRDDKGLHSRVQRLIQNTIVH